MSTQVRSIAELERIRENTPESELHFLRQQDHTAWVWCIDGGARERRIAEESKRIAAAKKAAEPKPAALPPGERPVTHKALNKIMAAVGRFVREQIGQSQQAMSGKLADAARVAALDGRILELESRQADFEKRVAAHDVRHDAARKHLSNLEVKTNDLKRALAGEQPSGERIER